MPFFINMAYWHISDWMKALYPDVIWDKFGNGRTLYLTFDDGPTPEITEQVLDILEQYQAKATFFCLGRNVEKNIACPGRRHWERLPCGRSGR